MNMTKERGAFIKLFQSYMDGNTDHSIVREYAWSIIDYFTVSPSALLPMEDADEKSFWYAIWHVQHLADNEHYSCSSVHDDLVEALEILKMIKPMPSTYIGNRPMGRGDHGRAG